MRNLYYWRQLFVLSGTLMLSISTGIVVAYPTVLNAAILHSNTSDIKTTSDHASWISASNGISGIIGALIIPPIFQMYGRKVAHIVTNSCLCLGWIIFPLAKDVTGLYAARIIQGIGIGAMYIHPPIVAEYCHPKRRGYFITIKKVFVGLGTLICHSLQRFLTWRQISIFAIFPALLAIILTFKWPESPYYLALKGNYKECETSFRWLHGSSPKSELQLKALLDNRLSKSERNSTKSNILAYLKTFAEKDFCKALLITTLLTIMLDLCGRYYFFAYVMEITTSLVKSETAAFYLSVSADTLTVIAIAVSSLFVKRFDRRVLLFVFGSMAAIVMLLISLIVYLNTLLELPPVYLWVTAVAIMLQSTIVSVGVTPIVFILIGEIFPLDHKGKGISMGGIVFMTFYALTLKSTPMLIEKTGLHGTYAIYALLLCVSLFCLMKVLPETRDKTLLQIEDELNNSMIEMNVVERDILLRKT